MPRTLISEAEGYELLKSAGIPVPRFAVVHSPDEAIAASGTIGYPLVMKVISQQVVHKSDAGGVVTGIKTPAEAGSAYSSIVTKVKTHDPAASITGIIVEQQLPPGLELIVGGRNRPDIWEDHHRRIRRDAC